MHSGVLKLTSSVIDLAYQSTLAFHVDGHRLLSMNHAMVGLTEKGSCKVYYSIFGYIYMQDRKSNKKTQRHRVTRVDATAETVIFELIVLGSRCNWLRLLCSVGILARASSSPCFLNGLLGLDLLLFQFLHLPIQLHFGIIEGYTFVWTRAHGTGIRRRYSDHRTVRRKPSMKRSGQNTAFRVLIRASRTCASCPKVTGCRMLRVRCRARMTEHAI